MSFKLARNVFKCCAARPAPSLDQLRREGHQHARAALLGLEASWRRPWCPDRLGLDLADSQVSGLNGEARLRFLALLRRRQPGRWQACSEGRQAGGTTEGVRAEIERRRRAGGGGTGRARRGARTPSWTLRPDWRGRSRMLAGVAGADGPAHRMMAAVDAAVENCRILVSARPPRAGSARQLQRRLHACGTTGGPRSCWQGPRRRRWGRYSPELRPRECPAARRQRLPEEGPPGRGLQAQCRAAQDDCCKGMTPNCR
jgi:hypothetical protein